MIQKGKKATINDVANLAGVSKKTVSRVINKSPKVSDKTREKVEQIMLKLNYTPDPQARGLASKKSFLLGLVYDNPNASYVADIQQGVLDQCRTEGYELVVHPCDHRSANLVGELSRFIDRLKLDGVVLLPPLSENTQITDMLAKSGCQYARIASVPFNDAPHLVQSDDEIGMNQIADHLVELGHRDIGFIHGPKDYQSAQQRYKGFKTALSRHGITLTNQHVAWGAYTYESGTACAESLLATQPRPTAIVASNDEMALGVLVTAANRGVAVPEELSIVGYDDEPHASKIYHSLTTVNQNVQKMGQLAATKLVALCRGDTNIATETQYLVTPDLITRQSTARAPF